VVLEEADPESAGLEVLQEVLQGALPARAVQVAHRHRVVVGGELRPLLSNPRMVRENRSSRSFLDPSTCTCGIVSSMMRERSLEGISSIVSEAFTIHRDAHAPAFSPRLKDRLMDSPSGIEGFEPAEVIPLTRAMAAGNEEAYRRFHRLYAWRLFRLGATLLGGDLDAAADLVQETMVRVVRGIRRFDTELAFWNWLAAILRNLSIDHRRLRERQRKLWESRGSLPFESSREAPEELDLLESALSQVDDSAAQ
jgi:hypothetical protein